MGSGLVCSVFSIIFFLVIATLLVIVFSSSNHNNEQHNNNNKRYFTNDETDIVNKNPEYWKNHEFNMEEKDDTCRYGFEFLETLTNEGKKITGNNVHRLLPANRKQNFSGALFTKDFACLDTMDAQDGQWVGVYDCHGQGRNQMVTFTARGLILSGGYMDLCLAVKNLVSNDVILKKCNQADDTQVWSIDSYRGWLMPSVKTHYCLTAPEKDLEPVTTSTCKLNTESQKWQHTLQEVLSLWVEGTLYRRKHKRKKGRAKINKVLLQRKRPSVLNEDLFG